MMEWISVRDRLPENISTVIVSVKEIEKPTTAWYGNARKRWTLTERDFCEIKKITVTHWMPLPEPPKE